MSTTVVLLLGGLPGAGKSHLAQLVQRRSSQENVSCRIVEYDEIEAEQKGDNQEVDSGLLAWRQARKTALTKLGTMLSENSDQGNHDNLDLIILDDNFYLRSMRKQLYMNCQASTSSKCIYFAVVWLQASVETCLWRNSSRTRKVDPSVIHNMNQKAEPPGRHEMPTWERSYLFLRGDDDPQSNVDAIFEFVRTVRATAAPVAPPVDPAIEAARLEGERQQTKESLRHQADQQLRSCVKCVAKINSKGASVANRVRQSMLKSDTVFKSLQQVREGFCESFFDEVQDGWNEDDKQSLRRTIEDTAQAS